MTFKTRVLDSSQTSPELNQPKKCKLVLVDAHQGQLKHKCLAMHMMTWPILVTITPGVLQRGTHRSADLGWGRSTWPPARWAPPSVAHLLESSQLGVTVEYDF
jgi:hypothetical protein